MASGKRNSKRSSSKGRKSVEQSSPSSSSLGNTTNNQPPTSTTSLGKRRSLSRVKSRTKQQQQQQQQQKLSPGSNSSGGRPQSSVTDYGSQSSPMRIPTQPSEISKVAILGAAGGIGQPLSLLLMLHSEYIQHLALYDVVDVPGVGADVCHIDRQCRITTHLGPTELADAVRDAKLIIVPAGLAQKPGMSRDDLFGSNAHIMYNLAKVCALVAPNAMLAIISNPVNSLVPLACEVYSTFCKQPQTSTTQASTTTSTTATTADNELKKQANNSIDCTRRIFGVTTLDVVRASTLTARSAFFKQEASGLFKDPAKISVPVLGGHAGKTIVPILSQATPKIDEKRLTEDKHTVSVVVSGIQEAGIEVLNMKKGKGSATLSMAYAACRFAIALMRAMQGESNIVECAYVRQPGINLDGLEYFSTPLLLGKDGWTKSFGLGKLLPFEQQMIADAVRELKTSVAKGEDFARAQLANEATKKTSPATTTTKSAN